MTDSQQDYSNLEALYPGHPPRRHEKPLPSDPGKQVVVECGKQYVLRDDGLEVAGKHGVPSTGKGNVVRLLARLRWPRWLLVGGPIALVIIVAAVLGGVLGSRHVRSKATPPATSGISNPPVPSPTATPVTRNIAAISFLSGSVNNTRVYYQDNFGQLMEAANSAANEKWVHHGLGFSARNGSTVAAAVSRPDSGPLQITLLYLNPNNLLHDAIYNTTAQAWSAGNLADQQYILSTNSRFSVMYNQCRLCSNTTIIAFQDQNGDVQVGNLTSAGWTLSQLELDPQLHTGLALQPFYRAGMEDQINLYYQKADLNMSLASWKPAQVNDGVYGWSLTEQTYSPISPGAPIAAASSYSNVSTGFEDWIEVLSLSSSSIKVNTWSGAINDWLELDTYPSVMANLSSKANIYDAVAVTAIGKAFAVVHLPEQRASIATWQVEDDTVDWTSTGKVDIGSVWD